MKVAHLADLHLGYRAYHKTTENGLNQREVDVARAFKEAVDRVLEAEPDLVVVAGDIFHSVRPPNTSIHFAFQQFLKLYRAELPVVLIAGNHETPKSKETGNILGLFREIGGFTVAYNVVSVAEPLAGVRVVCVPHNAIVQHPHLVPDPEYDGHEILLVHAPHSEYQFRLRVGLDVLKSENIDASAWSYVALGDFHTYTVLAPNMIYPGAIERTSNNIWAETEEKGFVVYDLDSGEHEFVALSSPRPVVDLGPFDGLGLLSTEIDHMIETEVEGVDGGIGGKIVRILFRNVEASVERGLDHKRIAEYKKAALHFQPDFRRPPIADRQQSGDIEVPAAHTLEDEFREYVEERFKPEHGSLPRKEIVSLGMRYLEDAKEREQEKRTGSD